MKKNEHLILRFSLFTAGIAVLIAVFFLIGTVPIFKLLWERYIISCVIVMLLYFAAFLPTLLVSAKLSSSLMVASAVYYKGFSVLAAVSVINIVLMFCAAFIPIGINIAVQCAFLFAFVLWAFITASAKGSIDSLGQKENQKKAPVMELKNKARRLLSLAEGLEKDDSVRKRAEKIADDLQYLSPGNTEEEHDIERRMIGILDSIIMDGYFYSQGEPPSASLESKFSTFETVYRERKNML